jgi:hypothetical protein
MLPILGQTPSSARRRPIPRINLQRRISLFFLPEPGLSNKRIRSRLRAIYPYSLGFDFKAS